MPKIPLEVVPWPADSILNYSKISDGQWGYLIIFQDLTYYFDQLRIPTESEILEKWEHRFISNQTT